MRAKLEWILKKESDSKNGSKGNGKKIESVGNKLAKHISKSCVKLLFLFFKRKTLGNAPSEPGLFWLKSVHSPHSLLTFQPFFMSK